MNFHHLTKPMSAIFLLSGYAFAQEQQDQMETTTQPMGIMPQKEITPSANPKIEEGGGAIIAFSADFIYWNPREEGLSFAVTGNTRDTNGNILANPSTVQGNGKIFDPDFDWIPGCKVGFGLDSAHDGWDLFANYTWLRRPENEKRTAANVNVNNFVAVDGLARETPTIVPAVISVSGSWRLQEFNVVDLDLGRSFFISQFLVLRPSFGFKGTWQRQIYDVSRYGVNNNINAPFPVAESLVHQNMRNWGFGIRSGLNTTWHLNKVWGLYGNMFLTGLWSHFSVVRVDTQTNQFTSGIPLDTKHRFRTILPVVELAVGLKWENWFWHDTAHLALSAGWEQQIWSNMNQFLNLSNADSHGNLTMHGLDVKLRFEF